jgi:hypothetical protein
MYDGLEVSEAKRLIALEEENAQPKKPESVRGLWTTRCDETTN